MAKQSIKSWVSLALLSLCACTTVPKLNPTKDPKTTWQGYQAAMSQVSSWTLQGLLGIRMPQVAQSAHFIWKQQATDYNIEFYGPLGLGSTLLQGNPIAVQLTLSNGKVVQARDAEELLQTNLGWTMPVEGAKYWVRGLPAPGSTYTYTLNAYGLLASLHQQGWVMTYQDYQVFQGWPLAHKIKLERGDLHLTVILNQWQVKK